MRNENVEYNEVRCKNLIIGDEETGYINLKVNQIDDSPCLEIQSNDGNEDSSITIGYKDGTPIISLITKRTNQEPTDETESQKRREGILLVNNSEATLMDIKGQKIGSRNLKKENTYPEGESNE